ncbi:MAG: Wzt carbohydrate-binding domain-containing protein [Acidobacteria bacterium]|nr:Wzt carbohydrate-binding domain-containing protein [Acidobacteriota bacterium]MBI3281675.1 Wzt carbohydrate-binding domain-containing protein [Acidobacteriota bacterium]
MAITFRGATLRPVEDFTATAPNGAVIGIVGGAGSGAEEVLEMAARGCVEQGTVTVPADVVLLGPEDMLERSEAGVVCLSHTLALKDRVTRARMRLQIERIRRQGGTVLLASHEPDLLRELCDEIWWLRNGRMAAQGHPAEVLEMYQRDAAAEIRRLAAGQVAELEPSMRRGDGRARLVSLDLLDAAGAPTMTWMSGETAAIRVLVRFESAVAEPVIGIMIRTRIGFEVYGTNTELEKIRLGPCGSGDTREVTFTFACSLCPQEYTVTAASHDPDGVWHDWLEDAVAFTVADSRYTAGVANLRAGVSVR